MFERMLGVILLVGACGAPGDEPVPAPAQARGALVGGREASAAEFPATVLLDWSCTGAKVGPHLFLTAAHCYHDTERNTVVVRPEVLVTTKDAMLRGSDAQALDVENVHVMQSWLDACVPPCGANVLSASHPPDIALIAVRTDTPDIAEAVIDISPVVAGDPVVETGYGCEEGYDIWFDYDLRRLKHARSAAIGADRLLHAGSFVSEGDEGNVAASYVLTPGFDTASGQSSSLCPGDSGGPLYRDEPSQRRVVGVNAYYTFPNSPVSATDWHTRLDVESRFGVASWLSDLGANVVDGRCEPLCEGKSCGPDGCGGECGSCGEGDVCTAQGLCEAVCVPSCEGKLCGDDGCGGSCGACEPDAAVEPPLGEPDAGEASAPPEDEPDVETNIDEATAGQGDFCADHPGTPECAVTITGQGCQLTPGPRKGEDAAYLMFFALSMLCWRWRRPARAANLAS